MNQKVGIKFIAASLLMHAVFLFALSRMSAGVKVETAEPVRVRLVELPKPAKIEKPERFDALSQYSSKAKETKIPSEQPGGVPGRSSELPAGELAKRFQPGSPAAAPDQKNPEDRPALPTVPPSAGQSAPAAAESPAKKLTDTAKLPPQKEAGLSTSIESRERAAIPKVDGTKKEQVKLKAKAPAAQDKEGGLKRPEAKAAPEESKSEEKAPPTIKASPGSRAASETGSRDVNGNEEGKGRKSVAFLRNDAEGGEDKFAGSIGGTGQRAVVPGLSEDSLQRYASAMGSGSGDSEEETVSINSMDFKYFSYLNHIRERIKSVWRYPPDAGAQGIEGSLAMRFSIVADGSLEGVTLLSSSGYSSLDNEVIRAVRDSAPFYPLPRMWGKKQLNINAIFTYRNLTSYIRLR